MSGCLALACEMSGRNSAKGRVRICRDRQPGLNAHSLLANALDRRFYRRKKVPNERDCLFQLAINRLSAQKLGAAGSRVVAMRRVKGEMDFHVEV